MVQQSNLLISPVSTRLLKQLIEMPDLPGRIASLPPASFAALLKQIGLEDASEIIAFATSEQLIAAFDEDLFVNDRPGGREAFDADRFAVWLQILIDAGETAAAARFVELSEDFVVSALAGQLLVLDNDALGSRLGEGDDDAHLVDKAIESTLSEEIDGYLLISRRNEGWDSVLSLILALDRDHRTFLERILDRMAALSDRLIDNLELFRTVLTDAESLVEDVEGEREARRILAGHVPPRDARSFLRLSLRPVDDVFTAPRDPVTAAFFREFRGTTTRQWEKTDREPVSLSVQIDQLPAPVTTVGALPDPAGKTIAALFILSQTQPDLFHERMEEIAYLANALSAGASRDGERLTPLKASKMALEWVAVGAEDASALAGEDLVSILRKVSADVLFRAGVSANPETPGFQLP